MATSEQWPQGLPAGGFRIARRSNHLTEAVAFYGDLVGLPLLMAFKGADTPDGPAGGTPVAAHDSRLPEPALA